MTVGVPILVMLVPSIMVKTSEPVSVFVKPASAMLRVQAPLKVTVVPSIWS